jgi:mRNA interferase RelE/StbE
MSAYKIEFAKAAIKQLAKLPKKMRQRLSDRIEELVGDPRPAGCKKWPPRNPYTGCLKEITG